MNNTFTYTFSNTQFLVHGEKEIRQNPFRVVVVVVVKIWVIRVYIYAHYIAHTPFVVNIYDDDHDVDVDDDGNSVVGIEALRPFIFLEMRWSQAENTHACSIF